jgi:hypothetical protein
LIGIGDDGEGGEGFDFFPARGEERPNIKLHQPAFA